MATSTAIAEAKPTMAARPSHVSGPPPFFALCSHLMMDSDLLLTALQETTRLLLGAADAWPDTRPSDGAAAAATGDDERRAGKGAMRPDRLRASLPPRLVLN